MTKSTVLRAFLCLSMLLMAVQGAQAAGGDLFWAEQLDIGGDEQNARDVAIHGDRIFVVGETRRGLDVDGLVRAYDAATGRLLWQDRFDRGLDFVSAVAVDGSRVFIAGSSGAFQASRFLVRAYDGNTGALLWQDEDSAGGPAAWGHAIIAHAGRVFAAGGFLQTNDSRGLLLKSYDARSGNVLWEDRRVGEIFGYSLARPLAVDSSRLYLAMDDLTSLTSTGMVVRAYDAVTGVALWEDRHGDQGYAVSYNVATDSDRVFVVGAGSNEAGDAEFLIRTYEARTGALLWQNERGEAGTVFYARTVATAGGVVFAGGTMSGEATENGSEYSLVRAFDQRSGALLWEHIGVHRVDVHALAAEGNRLAVAEGNPFAFVVRMHDARTGEVVWEDSHQVADGLNFALGVALKKNRVFAVGAGQTVQGDFDLLVRSYTVR